MQGFLTSSAPMSCHTKAITSHSHPDFSLFRQGIRLPKYRILPFVINHLDRLLKSQFQKCSAPLFWTVSKLNQSPVTLSKIPICFRGTLNKRHKKDRSLRISLLGRWPPPRLEKGQKNQLRWPSSLKCKESVFTFRTI